MQHSHTIAPIRRHHAWAVVAVATLTMTVSYIDRQALAALAPTVRRALHVSDASYGWLQASFSMAYSAGRSARGAVDRSARGAGADSSSRMLAWSLVAAAHALVPSLAVLFMLRLALGCAEAPGFPGRGPEHHHRVLAGESALGGHWRGFSSSGSSIGGAIAPVLAYRAASTVELAVCVRGHGGDWPAVASTLDRRHAAASCARVAWCAQRERSRSHGA